MHNSSATPVRKVPNGKLGLLHVDKLVDQTTIFNFPQLTTTLCCFSSIIVLCIPWFYHKLHTCISYGE